MSTNQLVKQHIQQIQAGQVFTSKEFLSLGSRSAVDKSLSRLVAENQIKRVRSGVFVRAKKNRLSQYLVPDLNSLIQSIAESNHETIQPHGAEAARLFKLSTQVPLVPTFYTSGSSRKLHFGKLTVQFIHTSDYQKLQFPGKKSGLALSALWYLGKNNVTIKTIQQIAQGLTKKEFLQLAKAHMPAWMKQVIMQYKCEYVQ